MLNPQYYIEKAKQERLLERKNEKTDEYNGVFSRYRYPVLTREHIPLTWRYDLDPETNPNFEERLGVNAVSPSRTTVSTASVSATTRFSSRIPVRKKRTSMI